MGKFYRDTHAAAVAARSANETNRANRAKAKAVDDVLQSIITGLAAKGNFTCLLLGAEELENTDTLFSGRLTIDRLEVIECAPELVDAIAARLQKTFDFAVSQHSVGIKRISWEAPEQAPNP
jgi:hypothetical protein